MAISLLSGTASNYSTSASSVSVTHTLPSGNNRLLCVAVSSFQATYVGYLTSLSYNGSAMNYFDTASNYVSGTGYQFIHLYYLYESGIPASGGTVYAHYASAVTAMRISVFTLNDVQQTEMNTFIQKANTSSGTTITMEASTPVKGGWLIGIGVHKASTSYTHGTSQVEIFDQAASSDLTMGASYKPTTAPIDDTLTLTAATSAVNCGMTFSVSPYGKPLYPSLIGRVRDINDVDGGTTASGYFNVSPGISRVCLIIVNTYTTGNAYYPTTVSMNGQNLSAVPSGESYYYYSTGDTYTSSKAYYRTQNYLGSGSQQIIATFADSFTYCQILALVMEGVRAQAPTDYGTYSNLSSNTASFTINTSYSNSLILASAFMANKSTSSISSETGIRIFNAYGAASRGGGGEIFQLEQTQGSKSVSITLDTTTIMTGIAFAFAPIPVTNGSVGISPYMIF